MVKQKHKRIRLIMSLMMTMFLLFSVSLTANADVGRRYDKFSKSYSLSGNAAADMVAIAKAQVGLTNSTLSYSGSWCAAFINDCATLANQENAIPFISGKTHGVSGLKAAVIERGGQEVSSPRAGDLVFYYNQATSTYCHVGLMINDIESIEGNLGGAVKQSRPSYYIPPSSDQKQYIKFIYVRPNYKNITFTSSFPLEDGMTYRIVSALSNKVMTAEGDRGVLQYSKKSGVDKSQIWRAVKNADGYNFVNVYSEKALDIPGASTETSEVLQQYQYNSEKINQRFKLVDRGSGKYSMIAACSNLAIDLCGDNADRTKEGAFYDQHYYHGEIQQQWYFEAVDITNPQIKNIKVTDLSQNGYIVWCDVVDAGGIDRVEFPTWTEANGQDDLIWKKGVLVSGNTYKFEVKSADHNNEIGIYTTHIYAYDKAGNMSSANGAYVRVPDQTAPSITNVKVENITNDGFTVRFNAVDNVDISLIQSYAWTEYNGQDDVKLYDCVCVSGNTYSFNVNRAYHNNEVGNYLVNIHATDAAGNLGSLSETLKTKLNDTFTLTIDPNGGEIFESTVAVNMDPLLTYHAGSWCRIPVSSREGYILKGYYTAPTGGVMVYNQNGWAQKGTYWDTTVNSDQEAAIYIYPGNLTVYAQWEEKLAISKQPQDVTVVEGNTANFAIEARGEGVNYQWQYKKATESSWTSVAEANGKTKAYSFTAELSKNNTSYRCVVTNKDGQTEISNEVNLSVTAKSLATPVITGVSNTATGVQVKWNAVNGAAQYRVFYKTGTGAWTGYNNTNGTSMTVTGLTAGKTYSFTVRCLSADGKTYTSNYNTTGKSILYQPAMLAKPEITGLNSNASGVQVTWGAVSGAAQYRVFYKTATGAWTTFGNVKGTSATVTGLTSGTTYTFLVRCLSADAKAYTSDYDATKSKRHTYIAQPAVSSVSNAANGVEVKWNAIGGAAQYRVFYKAAGGAWTGFNNTTGTSMVVTDLTAGTTYSFTVRCVSADGKSYTSTYDTTGKSIVYQPAASTMLAKPEITALNSNSAGVQVSWGAVSGAAQYRVFYKTAAGAWTTFGNTTGTSLTVTGLTSGTTYTFLVRCLSADGKAYTSDYDASKSKSHTYVAQPAVSSVTNTTAGVEVKWNAVGGAAQYRVFYKAGSGAWTGYKNTTGTSMTVTGLTTGTTYSFTVRCVSADGKSYTSTYDTTGKSIKVE